jgi:glutamate dehydrogenase/leucine dehydrogenase
VEGKRPWGVEAKYDIALPCATQNEVSTVAGDLLFRCSVAQAQHWVTHYLFPGMQSGHHL